MRSTGTIPLGRQQVRLTAPPLGCGQMPVAAGSASEAMSDLPEAMFCTSQVKAEMEHFDAISKQILAQVCSSPLLPCPSRDCLPCLAPDAAHSSGCLFVWQGEGNSYFVRSRFNLHSFWADHKAVLPLHYAAYLVEVGCKKAAAANVETVFSGAGKYTDAVSARLRPSLQ